MGTACVGCGKSGGLYQAYVILEIRFSITKDNISKIQMSLHIVKNNMSYGDNQYSISCKIDSNKKIQEKETELVHGNTSSKKLIVFS